MGILTTYCLIDSIKNINSNEVHQLHYWQSAFFLFILLHVLKEKEADLRPASFKTSKNTNTIYPAIISIADFTSDSPIPSIAKL